MKTRVVWSIALLAILLTIPFSGCKKDDLKPTPDLRKPWYIGWLKNFRTCEKAYFFCIQRDFPLPLPMDTYKAIPVAKQDGSVVVTGEMNTDNLSPEARATLFERGVLELTEDAVLGEDLLRSAYENSGLPYNGQQLVIKKGSYSIHTEGDPGARPIKITITIVIEKDRITIIIKW